MIEVLIVEDSEVVGRHIKHILESGPGIHVAGMVYNGEEAVRFVHEKKPDVITMDVNMPVMNGLDATRKIMETQPVPIIIVSASFDKNDVKKSFLAMEAGAVAISEKPYGEGHVNHIKAAEDLIRTVRLMSEIKLVRRWPRKPSQEAMIEQGLAAHIDRRPAKRIELVAIGASTGGPPVIHTILSGLPAGFPVPILIVQHIARGFLEGMVDWIKQATPLPVHIAMHGERLMPGHIYFAPDDFHMGLLNSSRISLGRSAPENGIRPSVSYLFRCATRVFGGGMAGVLLSGMGTDGAEELKAMNDLGAMTIAQDRESSVVYGMPGEAVRLNGAAHVLAPEKIAPILEGAVRIGRLVNN